MSLDSTVHACGSSAPEAPKGVVRGAQITHKRHLVRSEKCRRQGQITTHSRQAGQRADSSAELTDALCGNPWRGGCGVREKPQAPE